MRPFGLDSTLKSSVPLQPARCALITRPRSQGVAWQAKLRTLGVSSELLPLLDIAPAPDEAAVSAWFDSLDLLPIASAVMFVSANAVEGLVAALPAGWAWPGTTIAAATGPGTVAALRAAGVPEGLIVAPPADSPQFDSEALWRELIPMRAWAGQRVAIVRSGVGRNWLAERWAQAGAYVEFVQSYARCAAQLDHAGTSLLAKALAAPQRFAWLLSSSEAVEHLGTLAPPGTGWFASLALASHPRIAEHARALGFGKVIEVRPTTAAVAEALAAL